MLRGQIPGGLPVPFILFLNVSRDEAGVLERIAYCVTQLVRTVIEGDGRVSLGERVAGPPCRQISGIIEAGRGGVKCPRKNI